MGGQTDRWTSRQTHRQTDRGSWETDRTDRDSQIDKQEHRQTKTHTNEDYALRPQAVQRLYGTPILILHCTSVTYLHNNCFLLYMNDLLITITLCCTSILKLFTYLLSSVHQCPICITITLVYINYLFT